MTAETDRVLAQIYAERKRQEQLWGEQNHPLLNASNLSKVFAGRAEAWKECNQDRVRQGDLSWDGILLEEIYEALAERNPMAMRAELVQAAAVIVNMIECIDRQAGQRAAELLAGELEDKN